MGYNLEWDESNRKHVARHTELSVAEIEEVLHGTFIIARASVHEGQHGSEQRLQCVGRTAAGRLLVVIVTPRGEKLRPITAYPAVRRRTRMYLRYREENE